MPGIELSEPLFNLPYRRDNRRDWYPRGAKNSTDWRSGDFAFLACKSDVISSEFEFHRHGRAAERECLVYSFVSRQWHDD